MVIESKEEQDFRASSNRTWSVTGKNAYGQTQTVNVFASDVNQARVYGQRQVGGIFNVISVKEFNACSATTGTPNSIGIPDIRVAGGNGRY